MTWTLLALAQAAEPADQSSAHELYRQMELLAAEMRRSDGGATGFYGDLQAGFVGERLDAEMTGSPDAETRLYFSVPRALLGTRVELGQGLSVTVAGRLYQDEGTTTVLDDDDDVVELPDHPDVWAADLWEGRVSWAHTGGQLDLGVMPVRFGLRELAEERYHLGGLDRYRDLAWRTGIAGPQVLGASWEGGAGPFAGALTIANSEAHNQTEPFSAKDLLARLKLTFADDRVVIAASGLRGRRGTDATQGHLGLGASIHVEGGPVRVLLEGVNTSTGDTADLGASGTLGLDLGPTTVFARGGYWEPDMAGAADLAEVGIAGAFWFRVPELDRGTVSAGLVYEVISPRDVARAIEHDAAVEARVTF